MKYDQDFCLQCVQAKDQPLVIFSSPKSFDLQNVAKHPFNFYKNGEINQGVGLCLRQVRHSRFLHIYSQMQIVIYFKG